MPFFITLLSLLVISGGFIILHFALTHRTAELRVAGWVLVIGGVLTIAGAFYFRPPVPMAGAGHEMTGGWRAPKKDCNAHERRVAPHEKVMLEAPPPPADAQPPQTKGPKQ